MIRIGIGYDFHTWASGRKLLLGGVEIPFPSGLQGHSDADALLHAVADALLGAAALGDLGRHFPDTDPKYKDISSALLLERVLELITEAGFQVVNVDAVVIADRPRLAAHLPAMKEKIAAVLRVGAEAVNVKVKSGEGRAADGIVAQAAALLEKSL
ncbi:MAG: 2-C-methyl-D-erythritol 2,4-cyclodiphosphate synthase [Acidobacteria bacterium]|nr:2-C-methyl-D-erythritol 2,4-cyclodiphosphate synthase [Acidobacteriota bacterium]